MAGVGYRRRARRRAVSITMHVLSLRALFFFGLASCAAAQPTAREDGGSPSAAPSPMPPNVLMIVGDDVSWGDVPGLGEEPLDMPALARLAAEGVKFPVAYSAASICSPARAALLTGRYPHRYGHENNTGDIQRQLEQGIGLPLGEPTVAEAMRDAGYATGLVGKWHLGAGEEFHPLARGFDEYFGFLGGGHDHLIWKDPERGPILRGREPVYGEGWITDAFTEEALAFLGRHADEPFFLMVSYDAVHPPLAASEERLARFAAIEDERRRTYAAMLASLDEGLGRLLDELERLEIADRTVVLFLADNGGEPANGGAEGPFRGGKRTMYEGGLRIPLLARFPGTEPATYPFPVSVFDVSQTVLSAAGAELTDGIETDGFDLAGLIRTGEPPAREALYWRQGFTRAMRFGPWKMIRRGRVPPKLYNLELDPQEQQDVARKNPDTVRHLRILYDGWESQMADALWNWK